MQKTNSELRAMLVGVDKISKPNKKQLVDLVLEKKNFFNIKIFQCVEKS